MRKPIFIALSAAMLGACVGNVDGTGPTGDDGTTGGSARAQFDSDVAPLLTAKCASCHVGNEADQQLDGRSRFLGATGVATYYDTIVADRAVNGGWDSSSATLVTKGPHEAPAWWTDTEKATIVSWLVAEAAERGIDTGPVVTNPGVPVNTSARGLEMAWAACLSVSQTEYASTKAYDVANMNSSNGRCNSCHSPGGAGGAYWGPKSENGMDNWLNMLGKWQQEVFITGVFQAQAQPTNPVTYKMAVASSKICAKGTEQDNNLGTHPSFNCMQTVNGQKPLDNLNAFLGLIETKVNTAGACPTPAFAPPS
jgi:cytochrome c553